MLKKISSLQHPLVKHYLHVRQNRDYRQEHQSVIIEGIKPIHELASSMTPLSIMACDETLIPKDIHPKEILIVNEAIMNKVSGMKSPEGLIAEFPIPQFSSLKGLKKVLALDGISDPGNLGTLIRTALALGWEGVFITENSCDPYNEKALRAARGANFKLKLATGNWETLKGIINDNHLTVYVADIKGEAFSSNTAAPPLLLILGNEAHGPSIEASHYKKICIPMQGHMESLNVASAGSILMYLLGGSHEK